MEIMEAIKGRYMYRGTFQEKKIEKSVLLQLFEAARWAPSGHNSQPWEFLVIDDNKLIGELVAMAVQCWDEHQRTRKDLKEWVQIWWRWSRWSEEELKSAGDGIYLRKSPRAEWEKMKGMESAEELRARLLEIFPPNVGTSKVIKSPCLIFTLIDKTRKLPDVSQGVMELTSTGAAIQNLRLAAYSLGLAVHELSLLCDLSRTREKIGERLGIPPQYRIVSAMRVGYPGDPRTQSMTHVRRPLEELVHWNQF